MSPPILIFGAALAMELIAAISHRLIMHKKGWVWHKSHHRPKSRSKKSFLERNDLYPLVFAISTIGIMAWASSVGNATVMSIACGVTLYGFTYLAVHDLLIHQRLGKPPTWVNSLKYVRWVRESHRIHHLYNQAPYGFLLPITPANLQVRALKDQRNPLTSK